MSTEEASTYLELSLADVYVWLEDGGHFLRPPPVQPTSPTTEKKRTDTDTNRGALLFCSVCGLNLALHPHVKAEDSFLQAPTSCPYAQQAPLLLVLDPLRSMRLSEAPTVAPPPPTIPEDWKHSSQDILQSVDPRLIDAASRITDVLHLPQPMTTAGSATLALATQAFVQRLVHGARSIARNDRLRAAGGVVPEQQLLAPAHVVRALDSDEAMRIVGSVLGSVRTCAVTDPQPREEQQGQPERSAVVKQEVED